CDTNKWGVNCSNECQCTGQGAEYCDPVKGCICLPGWEGATCNDDINECNRTYDMCGDVKKECVNSLGSYACSCFDGFTENEDEKCIDMDECANPLTRNCHPETQRCVNTLGGYTCECVNGYTRNGSSCEDVNECNLQISGCAQMCDNKAGYYNCFCHFGYTLNDDRKTCTEVDDPCKQLYNKTCSHYCVISQDKAECRCSEGYRLMNNEISCEGCLCDNGWMGESCDIDVNECRIGTKQCEGVNTVCMNTPGDAVCFCENGFARKETTLECEDINECNESEMKSCHQRCVNTIGSYKCECHNGFIIANGLCKDINECEKYNDCHHSCENTIGGYRCSCRRGYKLDLSDRRSCIPDVECNRGEEDKHCKENQRCLILDGNQTCECLPGFETMADIHSCKDKDECEADTNPCEQSCT
ncbi:FBN2-like protein, partial [Mya arenaria]